MTTTNSVSFVTFGGNIIGTGHLFRCMSISEWIKFSRQDLNIKISFYLYDCDHESIKVSNKIIKQYSEYKPQVINYKTLNKIKWDIVIVDLLNAPLDLMKYLSNKATRVIAIDNISESRNFSDIAINPLYYKLEDRIRGKSNKLKHDLIGPEYQIIARKYKDSRTVRDGNVENILIIQGGADPNNVSEKILKELYRVLVKNSNLKVHVVLGPAALKKIQNLPEQLAKRVFIYYNIIDMDRFLINIDIAISSIGINAFEIASMGIPSIHVTSIEKELETGAYLEKIGVSILHGLFNESKNGSIVEKIELLIRDNKLRNNMKNRAFKIFNSKKILTTIGLILGKNG